MGIKKEDALRIVLRSAELYESNLKNKNLLFLFENKYHSVNYYEVVFESNNFLHLTGLIVDKDILSAPAFYQRCLAKTPF